MNSNRNQRGSTARRWAESEVEEDPVLALMKLGASDHMRELLLNGRLYMQPLRSFIALEADVARGDRHEGLARCWQANRARLDVRQGDEWVNVGDIVGQMLFRDGQADAANVFCMFALRGTHAEAFLEGRSTKPVDVGKLAFGNSVVVFTDGDELVRRVKAASEREELSLAYGLVEYVDPEKHHGPMGPFRKFSTFDYQSEFRFLVTPELGPARVITLGSLQDIAFTCPAEELNERLRLSRVGEPT